ncbi:spermidine/putrescine transport system ATP-binding protein [Streptosporangium becharense]|uniref:Spermidine/putrescine import ATP-binding protein PotA n=1 Tax=Streptosporangium becharense TaxID=1816182 RepID=A0A7W9MFN4_9ACTN|nr:ABC transporter ATP-binding protein [Streptosporangium becharense]MBB2910080.1 spermidine/putrescine transport system ATP-binding protein [Streptosporangium becharense]MBB5818965.1 spermidine/putrescine transport system ATP-binding protein [Streptosporangium becharense]
MTDIQVSEVAAVAASGSPNVPAIELDGVVKEYLSHGEVVQAVKGVTLTIAEGEFFSLLGPSGCGKTTTMRMIAGFEDPSRGSVRLHGQDVTNVPPNKRDVNMVFQSYALFPHMSVWENVAFGLRRKQVPAAEIKRRVGEMLEIVDLTGREKRRPREMSGGQQQRVALARALVNRPRALLLDEPLGALDLKLRQAMQIELKRIQREVGITFVYVTHDQSEALTMSDRIAVMNDGLVEQLAPPREIYERPATTFVAGFIGTSNLLNGTIDSVASGRALFKLGEGDHVLVAGDSHRAGDPIAVTVRPEKITISTEEPAGDVSVVRGTVSEVVYLGLYNSYAVRLADGAEVTVFQQNALDSSTTAERGDTVWLSWQPQHSYAIGS